MKMKNCFLLLSLLMPLSAAAMETPGLVFDATKTRFDNLVEWFHQGTPLSFDQFRGFYSGRCFREMSKDNSGNAFLGYTQNTDDGGPGFPDQDEKVAAIVARDSADYFDDERAFQKNKRAFKQAILQAWNDISFPQESPTLSWTISRDGRPDEKHEYVLFNGYIIDRWTALARRKYWGKPYNPGDVLGMCYYFKKLGG